MRNLTLCDIRLHPSTVASTFEEAMLQQVMPNAGDQPTPPGALFVRSLYRAAEEGFPPAYRCLVNTTLVSDSGFFGMRRPMHLLGADATDPRFRHVAGTLPDDSAVLRALRSGLLMVTIHLPFGESEAAFENELVSALAGEVGRATRVNNVDAALWMRDDSVVSGKTEYLVAAYGAFMRPELRASTLDQIRAAGGEVVESLAYHHVGTVASDEPSSTVGTA